MTVQSKKVGSLSGQPEGFPIFFLTEMWERYGFYVIQSLLIFYLVDELHINDTLSYVTVGSFTALSYINCFIGGIIADRLLGSSRSILLGGALLFFGYTLLGIHSGLFGLDIALSIISIGTGFLKPNTSELLSILYNDENKKESGYTLYYVGIYVGAISGSFIGGYLQRKFGWQLAFASSAVGALFSIVTFWYGAKRYKLFDTRLRHITIFNYLCTFLIVMLLIIVCYFVLHSDVLGMTYFILVGIACLLFLIYTIINNHGLHRRKLIAFLLLIILSVFYWGIYFQQFFTISLCIERAGKFGVPSSVFPAIESLGIILFGPVINAVWKYFQSRGVNISVPTRFSIGFLFNALGFLFITIGLCYASKTPQYINPIVIIVAYLLIAIGELGLSPTSLSMVTTLV
ncbi:MAG: peptide MFS transporter, partial [Neisseriaceae bacterium]